MRTDRAGEFVDLASHPLFQALNEWVIAELIQECADGRPHRGELSVTAAPLHLSSKGLNDEPGFSSSQFIYGTSIGPEKQ